MKTPSRSTHSTSVIISVLAVAIGLFAVHPARAGTTNIWTGGGGLDIHWVTGANWLGAVAPTAGNELVFSNTVSLVNSNNFPAGTAFSSIDFATPSGAFVLGGRPVQVTNISDFQAYTPQTLNLGLTNINSTLTISTVSNAVLNVNGNVSGSSGLTLTGDGTVNLNDITTNAFAGTLEVDGGTVVPAADLSLGTTNDLNVPQAGRLVLNGGTMESRLNLTNNSNRGIALGPTSGSGWGGIKVDTGNTLTYGGVMANNSSGTGGLLKSGYGVLALFGASTYTGPTTNSIGTMILDFTQPTAPTDSIINSNSSLTIGGGNAGGGQENVAQLLVNSGTAADSQGFASTFATFGGSVIVASNAPSGTIQLNLGTLNHAPGGTLYFQTPEASGGGHVTTTATNVNGILGGWALITGDANAPTLFTVDAPHLFAMGTNFATVDVNSNIVNFTGYSNVTSAATMASQVAGSPLPPNVLINDTASASVINVDNDNAGTTNDINAILWLTSSGGFDSISIGTNNTLRLGVYGGIIRNGAATGNAVYIGGTNTVAQSGSGRAGSGDLGTLTAGGPNNDTPGEIVFAANNPSESSGTSIFEAKITDNGAGAVTFVKMGPGSIKLDGNNTFSGGLYLLQGRVQFAGSEILNTNPATGELGNPTGGGFGNIFVLPGSYIFPTGTGGQPITNAFYVAGEGDAHEHFGVFRGGTYTGPINLIGDTMLGCDTFNIVGPISGAFNLTAGSPSRNGTVSIASSDDSWSGDTFIAANGGSRNNILISSNNEVIPDGFGKGNVTVSKTSSGRATWNMNGFNETINGLSSSGATGDGHDCLITNGTASTLSTLTLGNNDQSGTFGGLIATGTGSIGVTKIGAGVETFGNSETYTGNTTISNGVLQLSSSGNLPNSPRINIAGGTFDVSKLAYGIPAGQAISVSGGTFFISGATGTGSPVNFTNGTLEVTALNIGSANLTAPTVNLGASTVNYIQAANVPPLGIYPATFPVIHYTGALNDNGSTFAAVFPTGTTPPYGGFVSNDLATSTVYLVITNGPVTPFLAWVGFSSGALNSTWDLLAVDWSNTVTHVLAPYADGAIVSFDDNGRTNVVNITDAFTPLGVTVTNSSAGVSPYVFVGAGGISGTNGLTKLGTGTLILDNTGVNDFSGALTIGVGGTVQVGAFDTSGSVGNGSIADNGSLVFERTDNPVVANPINGSGVLQQLGTNSTLTLGGNNGAFSGTMFVTNNGTLQGGAGSTSALGATNASTIVASGSTVDANGANLGGAQIYVSGIGVTNSDGTTNGAIINSSAAGVFPAVARVTMQGDTVFGAPTEGALACFSVLSNRWDLRSPATGDANGASLSTGGNGYNLTKVGLNQVGIVGATVDPALGNIDVQNGILSIEAATTGLGDPTKTLTVENGATLGIFNTTNQFNKNIVLNGNGMNNSLGTINNVSGNNVIAGAMTVNGTVEISFRNANATQTGGTLTLNNSISGAGSLAKEDTNTLTIAGVDNHNGGTIINDGTLILNGINTDTGNTLTENSPQNFGPVPTMLGGSGTNKGPVNLSGTMWPGLAGTPSTFSSGPMTFSGGAAIFSLGSTTTAGGGVNDLLNVTGNFDGGFANVQINPVGLLSTSGTYTLVNFTGTRSGTFNGGVNVIPSLQPTRYAFSLDQATANQVNLTVTTGVGLMAWNGAAANGIWDVQNSQNWTNLNSPTLVAADHQFLQQDQVLLDDTIIASGGTNVLSIWTNNPVQPASITCDSTTNYVIQGPGVIGGTLNIVKTNSSTLTISGANTFSGTVTVSGGTLLVDNINALGSSNTVVAVTNGGVLDIGGPDMAANVVSPIGYRLLMLSGFGTNTSLGPVGANHNGCFINSGPRTQEDAAQNVLLTGDTAIGCDAPINSAGRYDFGRVTPATFSTGGQPYNLTKVGTNQVSFVAVNVDTNLGNVDIQGGEVGLETATTGLGDPTKTLTVESGAVLEFFSLVAPLNKNIVVNGGAKAEGRYPNIFFNSGVSTNNIIVGSVTITNGIVVVGGGGNGTLSNTVSGPGALTIAGNVYLNSVDTYTGNTTVSNGTLFLLEPASIDNSTNITVQPGAAMDVSGRVDGALTLTPGQTLTFQGNGSISGSLTNLVGAVSLVGTNGVATVTNDVTLGGAFTNQIGSSSNTVLVAGGNLTYGGTLVVATNASTVWTAGTSYKLFKAAAYNNGSFSSVTLPDLPGGLSWTNGLAVDGTIGIVSTAAPPFTHTPGALLISMNGADIVVTGTNGDVGSVYYLLATTNLADDRSLWLTVATNVLGSVSGPTNGFTFIGTNVVAPADAQQFYILSNTNAVH